MNRRSPIVTVQLALVATALFLVEAVALCLPALVNRGPILFTDTHGYYVGGRAALDKARAVFERHDGGTGAESVGTVVQNARAVRSAFYSVFMYLVAHGLSLWVVVAVQAIVAVLAIRLVFGLLCPDQPRWRSTLFILLLAVATTLSWTVSFAMPDLFTPLLVLGIIVAVLFWEQLAAATRWVLLAAITGTVVMHVTNPPVALGVLGVGALLKGRRLWPERTRFVMVGGAIGLGIVATLAVAVVGFKQWTLAPHSPPFLLARSIGDGPGKLYLREHCPGVGFAMCRHLDRLDVSVNDFIWDEDVGVYSAVSPEEKEQLRTEGNRIYVAAALEHPWMQGTDIVLDTLQQLVLFSLHEYTIPSSADYTDTEMTLRPWHVPDTRRILFPFWQSIFSVPLYLVVIAALGYALYRWRKGSLSGDQRDFFVLVLAAVLIQALLGGMFSEPSPRYEARVIWLIPMAALLFAYRRANAGR